MYTTNEILFPAYAIPAIRKSGGAKWQQLIDRLMTLPESHEEVLAFMLMMVRINGCMECETDSYRAMRGCQACALQTLRRYKGTDDDLLAAYEGALIEIREYLTHSGQHQFKGMLQAI